jgi:hypothetical protein
MSKNKNKNRYKKQAKKKGFLSGMNEGLKTKGDIKNSSLETGKDLLIGVIGGGLIGAAVGKPSLLVGIATTLGGHYSGNKLVQILGLGIMTGGTFKSTAAVSGLEGLDGVKERLQAFKTVLSDKFFLDKIKKKASSTNGIGELQYFTYPDGELAALNDIERQIEESAYQFQGSGLRGDEDDIQVGIIDLDDRLI